MIFLYLLGYGAMSLVTGLKMCDSFVKDENRDLETGGTGHSENSTTVYAMWVILASTAWPLYWPYRLVIHASDQLMLPPGDSV